MIICGLIWKIFEYGMILCSIIEDALNLKKNDDKWIRRWLVKIWQHKACVSRNQVDFKYSKRKWTRPGFYLFISWDYHQNECSLLACNISAALVIHLTWVTVNRGGRSANICTSFTADSEWYKTGKIPTESSPTILQPSNYL